MPASIDDIQKLADEALQAALNDTEAGRTEQAEALFRGVLELQPGRAEAHFGLGFLAHRAGRTQDALPHFAEALKAAPGEPAYWLAYLDALMAARQFATAGELLALGRSQGLAGPEFDAWERHIAEHGAPTQARMDAASALYANKKKEAAGKIARELAEAFPQHPFGWKLLGGVLYGKRAYPEALEAMQKAATYGPDDPETLSNLGLMLKRAGRLEEARSVLERAIELDPDMLRPRNYLAATLHELGLLNDALAVVEAILASEPDHVDALSSLAVILDHLGRAEEAYHAYQRVLALKPDQHDAHGNMLFCMSHMGRFTPVEIFEEHRRFGQRLGARFPVSGGWKQRRDPQRPLRIGFVSGDLRNHAIAAFIEPVLAALQGRPGLVVHAYYTHPLHDDTTLQLAGLVPHWRNVAELDDAGLFKLIQGDAIDILIDLSGHTAFNRLPVFARKPAPLQVSWLGYPGTTGVAAMDYYLSDRHILPPGQDDHLFVEKLVYLPVSGAFHMPADAPGLVAPPALANGYVTFGSFNRRNKLSREVIALWGRLLRAVPDARLVVAGMPESGDAQDSLQAWLAEEGVAPERLRFHPRTATRDYLALHNDIDICLDTFPYSGGTTTLYALYMGVPTLTLAGTTMAGRQTAHALAHHGLPQFIARDRDDFVEKGVAAARDLDLLARVRATLRTTSPLWTPQGVSRMADSLERALRLMWERWCAGLPPVSFALPDDPQAAPELLPGPDTR